MNHSSGTSDVVTWKKNSACWW